MSYAPDGPHNQPPYRPDGQPPQQPRPPHGQQQGGRRQPQYGQPYGQPPYDAQGRPQGGQGGPYGGQGGGQGGPYGQQGGQYGDQGGAPHNGRYDAQQPPYGGPDPRYGQQQSYDEPPYDEPPRRKSKVRRWLIAGTTVVALAGVAALVMSHFEIPPFTDKGKDVSFGGAAPDGKNEEAAKPPATSKMSMPTGPKAQFKNSMTLADGTHVAVTTLDGKKSGFKGKVWVWAPKEYNDPKFAKSGFPVMIALPGGAGYPTNYWMGTDLGLQNSISKWYGEGKGKPFILAMPVLNPGPDDKGVYWDGSDIPDQPKMGTWLTDDVPDLMRQNFRTVKSRDGWAYMGSSTGGFASLKAVLKYPEKFKAAICSGPDIVPDSSLWRGHEQEKAENNPELLAKQLIAKKGPDVYLAFQVGDNENNKKTLPDVKKFIATYGKGPIHTSLRVIPNGQHNAKTYVPNMGEGPIQFISKVMEGPVE
ncbi:alpha/beta hydrolase-fold protein [Streptomyces sp. NPDC051000]|uniref:alpha/beta hydrolase n=1 Tax=Streptomyces sp. NPDC051000 TaxID=3155520 RepID=UPI0033CD33B4